MFGIILAGGVGNKLWPLSRDLSPKQLLNLADGKSLLQNTFERLQKFIPTQNILVITNKNLEANVKSQIKDLANDIIILSEPSSKNTAPAITISTKYLSQISNSDDTIIVAPTDHLIKDIEKFSESVYKAEQLAQKGYIVTFGTEPKYPETGLGYIKIGENIECGFKVNKFIEKPDYDTAKNLIEDKSVFWNCGIIIFKPSVLFEKLKKHAPEIFDITNNIDMSNSKEIPFIEFDKMPNISIENTLLEKSDKLAMVELESDWSDLGDWKTLYDSSAKDSNGNVFVGEILDRNSKNSLVYSTSKLVATIGLEDTILVETEDAILACKKDKTQEVRYIYDELKQKNNNTSKVHTTVYRPWGFYKVIAQGEGFLTKIIHVNPKQKLSLQSHNHRSEHWVILSGCAKVILDKKELILNPNESIDIPLKAIHSLQNPYDIPVEVLEVQMGELLIEEDIIRYEDIYGRV